MGQKSAEDYSKFAKEAAKLMKWTDKNISLIAAGSSAFNWSDGDWLKWNRTVLYELYNQIDYISIHNYWTLSDDYNVIMGQRALEVEQKITIPAAMIKEVRTRYEMAKPIYLVMDEWAPYSRDFLGSLAVAQHFNSFIRHADVVKMANYTMLTSILSFDREKGFYKSPTFYIFKLFSNNCRGVSLDVFVDCEKFKATDFYKDIPYLDVTSSYSKDTKTMVINVVNRHKDNAISTEIISSSGDFAGKASASELSIADYKAPLTYDKKDQYVPVVKEVAVKGNSMTYSFPAHSFTQIIVKTVN
jgi:alpha-N-arabinofuranosidase